MKNFMQARTPENNVTACVDSLVGDIRAMVDESRASVAMAVNAGLTMLYWRIGSLINDHVLDGERARYGAEIISILARQLETDYGRGFSAKNVRHMMRFADAFRDQKIVSALWRQLSWSHFKFIIYMDDVLKRNFYAEMCRIERWSTRTLSAKVDSMLYERTALSRKPEELIQQELERLRENDELSPDLVFQDPYILDFLGIQNHYAETEFENAILLDLEHFLLEIGTGFAFMARQKRIQVDNDDYYIDLLFFHRGLSRLVAIELKLGEFKPADMGQMELYLRWLDRYERRDGEEAPLGIILCAGKKQELIELLELGQSGIHVAEYLTVLPPKALLRKKLQSVIEFSRRRELSNGLR